MYYHEGHYRHSRRPAWTLAEHPWFLCYAESRDGVKWYKPDLGLFKFNGSKSNNIVLTPEAVAEVEGTRLTQPSSRTQIPTARTTPDTRS